MGRLSATLLGLAVALAASMASTAAVACGGFFCDAAQPVNQAAERILFAQDPEDPSRVQMHVQINYQGPPTDFGWLLPVPPDVETQVGVDSLFTVLDSMAAPIFSTQIEMHCEDDIQLAAGGGGGEGGGSGSFADAGAEPGGGGVQVLSREAVGPYDQVVLDAERVEDLLRWLDENEFVVPEGSEARLEPYLEEGSVFLALKLLPDRSAGDITPLILNFTSDTPGVPLRPTAVAANPDMGVLVHMLGDSRAIPLNYRHVEINDALIDWSGGGFNYPDVVSNAVDVADGGHAFVTDSALDGVSVAPTFQSILDRYDDENGARLARLRTVRTVGDLVGMTYELPWSDQEFVNLVMRLVPQPEAFDALSEAYPWLTWMGYLTCPDCWYGIEEEVFEAVNSAPADGEAMVRFINEQLRPTYELIIATFTRWTYLTRLYTTLSPSEMTRDPIFGFNPDLEPVAPRRTAIRHIYCGDDGFPDWANAVVETPSGLRYQEEGGQNPHAVARQGGETIRGVDEIPAARVERITEQGQPIVISSHQSALQARYDVAPRGGEDGGCDCQAGRSGLGSLLWPLIFIGALRRRRRAHG